ncbi:hypothetical protein MMPV_007885 [Pyropia vietnamensis]
MDVVRAVASPPAASAGVVPTAVPPPGTDGRRRDGRAPSTVRAPTIELGWHATADGSCRWTVGATTVTAAVVGPADCPPARQMPDAVTLAVTVRSAAAAAGAPGGRLVASVRAGGGRVGGEMGGGVADPAGVPSWDAVVADRAAEGRLAAALQAVVLLSAHPRAAISVAVHVVTAGGGGVEAAVLNAAAAALVDAGVPLRGVLAAGSVAAHADADATAVVDEATTDGGSRLWVDPTVEEAAAATTVLTVATLAPPVGGEGDAQYVAAHVAGRLLPRAVYGAALASAAEAAGGASAAIRAAVERRLSTGGNAI